MRSHDPGRVLRAGAAGRARDALAAREPAEPVARAPRDRQPPHPIGFATWLSNHRPFGLEWPEPERENPARAFFAPSSRPNGSAASLEPTGQRMHGSGPARRPPRRQSWSGKAMILNALECDDAAKSIIKSRAEPSRAEPSRAEPSRAEPSRAEPSRAEPSRAEPSSCPPGRVKSRLSGGRPGWPPDFFLPRPCGAQSDSLPTNPPGTAPASRRREPAAGDRRRGPGAAVAGSRAPASAAPRPPRCLDAQRCSAPAQQPPTRW